MIPDSGLINGRNQAAGAAGDLVAIGIIRKPVGLKGQCYVDAFGATLAALKPPARLRAGRDLQAKQELVLQELRPSPKGLVCRFEGFGDLDTAGTLRGLYLFCGRDKLPKPPKGRHYHFELVGLTVVEDETGRAIGSVTEVQKYPAAEVLEVKKENGETVLISMAGGTVKSVDNAAGVIKISGAALEEIL
ncbi:MAG TPA: ribosome maturation factor RimM [Chitinivibrionales bacterium]|nr:ribosome maturation factor RimM [Chitinivibrionales bacterium]